MSAPLDSRTPARRKKVASRAASESNGGDLRRSGYSAGEEQVVQLGAVIFEMIEVVCAEILILTTVIVGHLKGLGAALDVP